MQVETRASRKYQLESNDCRGRDLKYDWPIFYFEAYKIKTRFDNEIKILKRGKLGFYQGDDMSALLAFRY